MDVMLGGLGVGSFIFLHGDAPTLGLAHLLCVRSQLPEEKGGLGSSVIWLDGGNTFNLYGITEISKRLGLDPERVLREIYISRAFTCYQMSSLVLEKLTDAVERFKSKLVVVSNLPYLYLESDIPRMEIAKAIAPVIEELRSLGMRGALVIATGLEHPFERWDGQLYDVLTSNADIILKVRGRRECIEVELEKHPSKKAEKVVFGAEIPGVVPLDEFAGGVLDG